MERVGKPLKSLKGRASTRAHHRKPSHDIAKRAFASKAGRGNALSEYAAEMIKARKILTPEDLERLVDSGAFGHWLDARAKRTVVETAIVAEGANPNYVWKASEKPAKTAAEIGAEYRVSIEEANSIQEKCKIEADREKAAQYCLLHRCPGEFEERIKAFTGSRHAMEAIKNYRQ